MAICKYCGKYHDTSEWPEQFLAAYTPNCCFNCYEENPERAVWGHTEETVDESEVTDTPVEDDSDDNDIPVYDPDPTDGEDEGCI